VKEENKNKKEGKFIDIDRVMTYFDMIRLTRLFNRKQS